MRGLGPDAADLVGGERTLRARLRSRFAAGFGLPGKRPGMTRDGHAGRDIDAGTLGFDTAAPL